MTTQDNIPLVSRSPTRRKINFNDEVHGRLLAPLLVYHPLYKAGVELLREDMFDVREHLNAISIMSHAEAAIANRAMTFTKANQVQQRMDRLVQIRDASPDGLRSVDMETFRDALKSLNDIRAQYLVLLPLTFRINHLPPELLMRIFRLSIWPLSGTDSDLEAAVCLSHVSRLWRSITISDQRLWNPVCFLEPAKFERSFAIMERAGPTGLDVRIRDKQATPISPEAMRNLMIRIFYWIQGIKRLDVFVFNKEAIIPVLEALGQISLLSSPVSMEVVELHSFLATSPANYVHVVQPLFGGAIPPFFKHLCLDGIRTDWGVKLLSRLTTLDLRRLAMGTLPSASTFRAILQNANTLEKLVLDAAGPMHPPNVALGLPPIVLPGLKILVIGGCTDAYFEYLLAYFKAPNVLDLTITFPINNNNTRLFNSLTTCNCMPLVQILTLVKFPRRDEAFPHDQAILFSKWLKTMPDLTFLRVINTNPGLFDVLAFDETTFSFAGAGDWPKDRPRKLICAKLKYFDWQTEYADLKQIQLCLSTRKSLGHPAWRLWISSRIASSFRWEEAMQLPEFLAEGGTVSTSELRTEEEARICPLVYPIA
ncbi:hypothetical protein CPB83DRAFT_26818 [Crepidotus variabilis]|uniref:F-box domain-containing protein n=1 Tax=Crepidotus variabilis TaxID=179855 RepID=A0A9P6EV57_9AGAR|nr:hypothetical protein CPB83DRAFT_26818 [Crepidotus variabilis]